MLDFLVQPIVVAIVGDVGFLLTVAGFAATIWQLRRTQTAVAAATTASQELRSRLAGHSAAAHSANAAAQVRAAQRDVRAKDWNAALDNMDALRSTVLVLYRRQDFLDAETRSELQPFIKDLADFCNHVERKQGKDITDARSAQISKRLRELSAVLTNLTDHLSEGTR